MPERRRDRHSPTPPPCRRPGTAAAAGAWAPPWARTATSTSAGTSADSPPAGRPRPARTGARRSGVAARCGPRRHLDRRRRSCSSAFREFEWPPSTVLRWCPAGAAKPIHGRSDDHHEDGEERTSEELHLDRRVLATPDLDDLARSHRPYAGPDAPTPAGRATMVGLTRIELVTSALSGQRSNRLSYSPGKSERLSVAGELHAARPRCLRRIVVSDRTHRCRRSSPHG